MFISATSGRTQGAFEQRLGAPLLSNRRIFLDVLTGYFVLRDTGSNLVASMLGESVSHFAIALVKGRTRRFGAYYGGDSASYS
jgi:hypothetical protein